MQAAIVARRPTAHEELRSICATTKASTRENDVVFRSTDTITRDFLLKGAHYVAPSNFVHFRPFVQTIS